MVEALNIIISYGQIDGDFHKAWVIDQVVRTLTGDDYEQLIKRYEYIEDDGEMFMLTDEELNMIIEEGNDKVYEWNIGIAP